MNQVTHGSVAIPRVSARRPEGGAPSNGAPTGASRRTSSRREVLMPCQAVREHDFVLVADRIVDVSTEGLLLPLRTHVLTGESLIVSFAIPGAWIDVEATVARVVHGRRPSDGGRAVGVVFDRVAPASRAALAAFLLGRREPLPRRGPLARSRRGESEPRVADEDVMRRRFDTHGTGDARPPVCGEPDVGVDGLGVLRAVVGAWRSLALDAALTTSN